MAKIPCEFFLVRYMPDEVKEEFVNIGVILREVPGPGQRGPAKVKFTRDWRRVKCIDPDADTNLLEELEQELSRLVGSDVVEAERDLVQLLQEEFSNSVEMTSSRGTEADNLGTEMDLLMSMYVESRS